MSVLSSQNGKWFLQFILLFGLAFLFMGIADAQGLEKANNYTNMIVNILRGVSIGVVTIAVMWLGFTIFRNGFQMDILVKIGGGCILIASASELARYMVGSW